MMRFTVRLIVLLVFCSALFSLLGIVEVDASGTIYIRTDGSVDPSTAPISTVDNVAYTFTDNLHEPGGIVVERSDIVIDGKGYTLRGSGEESSQSGLSLFGISNVTVQNLTIKDFHYGLHFKSSSFDTISSNNITNNQFGIKLEESSNFNSISGNIITDNDQCGVLIITSSFNLISGNIISKSSHGNGVNFWVSSDYNSIFGNNIVANKYYGVELYNSSSNSISENNIRANNASGILLRYSSNNNILFRNNVTNNMIGIEFTSSSNNKFYHNNFSNMRQVYDSAWVNFVFSPSINTWDDGYPSGGNYWSDYTGEDANDDGIGDTPYSIDENNRDRYPMVQLDDMGSGLPIDSNIFYIVITMVISIVAAVTFFVIHKKRKKTPEVATSQS